MIKRLTSKDNSVVKRFKQLEAKKYRDRLGLFVLEGPTVLEEALEQRIKLETVVYSDSFLDYPEAETVINKLSKSGAAVYSVDDRLFAAMSGTTTPQGMLAIAEKPEWDAGLIKEPGADLIVLDRVADPGNMGTVIRTAEAAGFKAIIVVKGSTDPYSGKVSRAAAGALMRMPIFYADSAAELVEMLRAGKKRIVCTDPKSELYYYDIDIARDTAIIIGNEASGVSDEIFKNADITAGIPMEGRTESLNAAIASGILMYESLRQRNIKNKSL